MLNLQFISVIEKNLFKVLNLQKIDTDASFEGLKNRIQREINRINNERLT